MKGYRELLEKEVVEAWRTYRFAGLAAGFLALGIASAVFTRYMRALVRVFAPPDYEIGLPPAVAPDVADQLLRNLILVGAVAAILLAMGAVAGERERGTAAFVLAKPVTRAAFLAAKWAALAMLFAVAIALAVLGAWLYTGVLIEPVPVLPWVQLGVVAWLSAMVYASITLLGSSLGGSPLLAGALGVAALLALTMAAAVPTLAPWLPAGLYEVGLSAALEESSIDLDPFRTIGASIAIVAGCLVVAWLALRRQEV